MKFLHYILYCYAVLALFFLMPSVTHAQENRDERLKQLDASLARRPKLEAAKTAKIDSIKTRLQQLTKIDERYDALNALYEEYKMYSCDSALAYAIQSKKVAEQMNNSEARFQSQCALAFCLISGGLLSEAFKYMDTIPMYPLASVEQKVRYYDNYSTLYRSIADYAHDDPFYPKYITMSNCYLDSMMALVDANSMEWRSFKGAQLMRQHKQAEAIDVLRPLLQASEVSDHEKAKVAAEIAWGYVYLGDVEKGIDYFARSAIYDNESCTREITALYHLSRFIDRDGDHERASRYVHQALADVQFYNSRLRKVEIGDILPIIERDRYEAMQSQRNWLIAVAVMLAVLILIVLYSYKMIHKKNIMLAEARDTIAGPLGQLKSTNEQLKESNEIKNAFVGRSFYANAEFIERLEKLFITIDRKIATRQYEDLRSSMQMSKINNVREGMYEAFDQTFLKLFPDFVSRYNELFEEKDRRLPSTEDSLTSEMRIFALIRLGITDSERIAKFLNYSVHTVNTYKTRIKNRSNDQFEQSIMQI